MQETISVKAPAWPRKDIEWVTVFWNIASVLLMIASFAGTYAYGKAFWPYAFILSNLGIYFCFTLGHESVHNAVSPKHRWINRVSGNYAGLMFHIPFHWFEVVHMRHHAFVNQEKKDPDMHCSGKFSFRTILLLLTTYFFYAVYMIREKIFDRRIWVTGISHYAVLAIFYYVGFKLMGVGFLWAFTIPMFTALVFTVFIFDYLPHYPHKGHGRFDNSQTYYGPGFEYLTQMHSFHIVHHLWPAIPWYRYKEVYMAKREELLKAGVTERHGLFK